jgi:hypothetical protein
VPAPGTLVGVPVRGTQSFVHTLSVCWHRPSLTALEVLWRWIFGIPTLWILWHLLYPAVMGAGPNWPALRQMTVLDPLAAANTFGQAIDLVAPPVWAILRWLAPLLIAVWIVISSIGRTIVLRRADPRLQPRIGTVMVLQSIRIVALALSFWIWFRILEAGANATIVRPAAAGQDPNLVGYCAIAIVTTLTLFVLWGVGTWALSVAPLLAMLRNLGVIASLRAAFQVGELKSKLVEINLVMGIVKIALIVLAMVFSACPLPFESVTSQNFLTNWWIAVSLFYFIGSDFFHVTRLVAYLDLWRTFQTNKN